MFRVYGFGGSAVDPEILHHHEYPKPWLLYYYIDILRSCGIVSINSSNWGNITPVMQNQTAKQKEHLVETWLMCIHIYALPSIGGVSGNLVTRSVMCIGGANIWLQYIDYTHAC